MMQKKTPPRDRAAFLHWEHWDTHNYFSAFTDVNAFGIVGAGNTRGIGGGNSTFPDDGAFKA